MKNNASKGYENAHLDIPGNPSTAKSSTLQLNQRKNNEPLNCFQRNNGTIGSSMDMLS